MMNNDCTPSEAWIGETDWNIPGGLNNRMGAVFQAGLPRIFTFAILCLN